MPKHPWEARPAGPRRCECVKTHVPVVLDDEAEGHHVWPLGEGGPDRPGNMLYLCGSSHNSVHALWRQYVKHGGAPPPAVLQRYRQYVRGIVADGWRQAHPPTPEGS
jgi:hypothetical protein